MIRLSLAVVGTTLVVLLATPLRSTVPGGLGVLAAQRLEPPPSLSPVLRRAGAYVTDFKRRLIGIVTEESYIQQVDAWTKLKPEVTHRELKSDLLLVQAADIARYVEFRDVAEVDGRAVRDRQERLTGLFIDPRGSSGQLQQIIAESARYNIGKVVRNVNTPLLALLFLDPEYQSHFTFTMATDRRPALADRDARERAAVSSNFAVPPEAWVVEYHESPSRTLIRSPEGVQMPAHGRFWLDPVDGRLLITELIAGDGSLRATINVSYRSQPLLGFSMPVEMRERYEAPGLAISGTATYGNFRRFNVQVQENVVPPER